MDRRDFIKHSGASSLGLLIGGCAELTTQDHQISEKDTVKRPIHIIMSGYSPPHTSFSKALTLIGDRLKAGFGNAVEIKYVYNIMDVGYETGDLRWLVDSGVLSLAYQTMSTGIAELELAALPFIFGSNEAARSAMDGELGTRAIESIESQTNYRILGFFENGFRHISNSVRPVRKPADLEGIKIRVLGIQAKTLELMGADPVTMNLARALPALASGDVDGQENPFENIVTYRMHEHQRYYTATYHSYLSRPIFINRAAYDSWPIDLQETMREAVRDAIVLQRKLHDEAEEVSADIIRKGGGEIIELTAAQRQAFIKAVAPVYDAARENYSQELLDLIDL
jgi:TRAP-type C4-dicarboxylate transport system substrate-binding protein